MANPADTRFTECDPNLVVGSVCENFEVVRAERVDELNGYAYVMRHQPTGARALWIACANTNRAFSIGFTTPPTDDTGVFHILEHSVLCGSHRHPVREPFVHLLKTSMQTFLNAMTYPDRTVYPVASTNEQDLHNLMGVYLDAVLRPAIYERPRIFEQEGWHYELDENNTLVCNGVVYNEMKGALSDPSDRLFQWLTRLLFPDTAYGYESGGNPEAIPELTYEAFIDTHARHYAPANSYSILYGDLDIAAALHLLGERLCEVADRAAGNPNPLVEQQPLAPQRKDLTMETATSNASVGLAWAMPAATSHLERTALAIAMDVIAGSNEAPLKRAVLDAGLGDDFVAEFIGQLMQPQLHMQLRGSRNGAVNKLGELVQQVCSELAEQGLPRDLVEASLAHTEFTLREADFGSTPDGVALALNVMGSWIYNDEAVLDHLRYEDLLGQLHAGIENGLFERVLRDYVCNNTHRATANLVPVSDDPTKQEREKLAQVQATMSSDELEVVRTNAEALHEEQIRPDTPEALATLPSLSPADIGSAPVEPAFTEVKAPLPCLAHELETHGIVYARHYFSLARLHLEELPWAQVLALVLGHLATEKHSAAELDVLVERCLGGLSFSTTVYSREDDLDFAEPRLMVSARALAAHLEDLVAIPTEVWSTTRFDDLARIRDLLVQERVGLEERFVGAGHVVAMARAGAGLSAAGATSDYMSGVAYYHFLCDLLDNWEARSSEVPATLANVASRVFCTNDVLSSLTCSAELRERFWEIGDTLGLVHSESPVVFEPASYQAQAEGLTIPSPVSYVVEAFGPAAQKVGTKGLWMVASRALSFDYLWNEVRVLGGAYGCGFRQLGSGLSCFWSFRDPQIDASLERYSRATRWLAEWKPDKAELDGYIVASVAALDAPQRPRQLSAAQDRNYLNHIEPNDRALRREEVLATTVDAIRELAQMLADPTRVRSLCVLSGSDALASATTQFDVVDELIGAAQA